MKNTPIRNLFFGHEVSEDILLRQSEPCLQVDKADR